MKAKNEQGKCRSCGADLVDWDRIHRKDVSDVQYTYDSLKRELIRHHFWHIEIDRRAINHARRKGRIGLQLAIDKRLRSSVRVRNSRDGRQTPRERNSIYYAQHAIACCCRKCIEYWHGIPMDHALSDTQIEYFARLCYMYICERLPQLTEKGEKVPYIRRRKGAS